MDVVSENKRIRTSFSKSCRKILPKAAKIIEGVSHMSTIIIFIFQHISLRHGGGRTSIFQFMYVIILTQGLLLSVPTPWEICLWNGPIRVSSEKYVGLRHFFVSIENTTYTIFNKILARFICDTKISEH